MTASAGPALTSKIFNAIVIVSALGYFVDIYDYYIFLVSRLAVLRDFGISGGGLTETGLYLVNMQFAGLLAGGIFFGILGDKLGRKQSLLVSILIYSVSTLASGLTQDFDTFALLRFIAGFGIAGEVGVGVTLISEIMSREKRAFGVIIFAGVGLFGVVVAGLLSQYLPWRTCYIIGGVAGLLLLLMRTLVVEPSMFKKLRESKVTRGSLRCLFGSRVHVRRYLLCILLAVPIFFGVSIVMTFSPELAAAMGVAEPVTAATTMIYSYVAMVTGEIAIGLLSERLQSRRRVIFGSLVCMAAILLAGLVTGISTATQYYAFAAAVGFCMGYWVNFIALSAEQFDTNLRATAATSIPNFARGTTVLVNLAFLHLKNQGIAMAAGIIGLTCIAIALVALKLLPESYGKDLDYVD